MGNPLKQIVCHFTFVLFILSVLQTSYFYSLPKQVLGCSCDFLSTGEKFQLVTLRGGNKNQNQPQCVVSEEYWSHL